MNCRVPWNAGKFSISAIELVILAVLLHICRTCDYHSATMRQWRHNVHSRRNRSATQVSSIWTPPSQISMVPR
jgi:hypothetical protein